MAGNEMYSKLIEQVVANRPDLAPFAEMFQNMSGDNQQDEILENKVRALEARLQKVSGVARRLKQYLDNANDELDDFAAALGACHLCWGNDHQCHLCAGKGKPGFLQPNMALFNELIAPALRHMPWIEIRDSNNNS